MNPSETDIEEQIPSALTELVAEAQRSLGAETVLAKMLPGCFHNSWVTATKASHAHGDGSAETFVLTGDIEAMWLRDSAAQLRPYLLAAQDPEVYERLAGAVARQARLVLIDPYANGFNDGPTGAHSDPEDIPTPSPWVWERKYEVDSLAAVLHCAYALWKAAEREDHLDGGFRQAAGRIVEVWRLEQSHHEHSTYRFIRPVGPWTGDTLPNDGKGGPVANTGMTWSGFRPSDDRCEYGYLIPANAMASTGLHGLAEIAETVWGDGELAVEARNLAGEIDEGIEEFGVWAWGGGTCLAYEVDGFGGVLAMDDANLPSLLGLPLTGWIDADDPVYRRTRAFALSSDNAFHFRGKVAEGVGSPHTPRRHVWPIAIAVAGMTGTEIERRAAAETLAKTTAGTGLMHESFHVDDPARFTRPWFGWANAVFAELVLTIAGFDIQRFYPRHPDAGSRNWV